MIRKRCLMNNNNFAMYSVFVDVDCSIIVGMLIHKKFISSDAE